MVFVQSSSVHYNVGPERSTRMAASLFDGDLVFEDVFSFGYDLITLLARIVDVRGQYPLFATAIGSADETWVRPSKRRESAVSAL